MADISKMVVRDAHVSDFGAVVTMHENLYGVMDYMPTLFPQILQDPRSNCFVAVLDGTPVNITSTFPGSDAISFCNWGGGGGGPLAITEWLLKSKNESE